MTPIASAIPSDKFSWNRVSALIKLMWPRLRKTIVVYFLVGVAAFIFIILLRKLPFFSTLLPFVVFIPSILLYISPAFVVNTMSASQFSLLPSTTGEKLAAYCLYGLIMLPVAVYILPQIGSFWLIFHDNYLCQFNPIMPDILPKIKSWQFMLSWGSTFLPGSVCLYSAVKNPGTKWRPAMMGVVVVFFIGFLGGIIGGITAFRIGYNTAVNGMPITPENEFIVKIFNETIPWMGFISLTCIILTIVFIRLTYRKLATRQL